MALANRDFVIGFISMQKLVHDPRFIHMTPGVKLETGTDKFGQQFKTPDLVINQNKSDVIIVGRGIYKAEDPLLAARQYREAGWKAYLNKIKRTS